MSDKTRIEWSEATWNPTTGCDRVSPGCANCYALTQAARLKAMHSPRYQRDGDPRTSGPGFGLTLHPDSLDVPLRWKRPRMIFVDSMSDLFHEEIPDEFIEQVFRVMAEARQHTFQVLTKRPERAREVLARLYDRSDDAIGIGVTLAAWEPLPNVWIGVSIENARYTWRADVLREIPAAVRFISAEPLLGSLFDVRLRDSGGEAGFTREPLDLTGVDWLIVGGESGGRFARPMHPAWARELRDACALSERGRENARVPAFFFKQWGSWAPGPSIDTAADHVFPDGARMRYAGASPKSGGRLLDGRAWDELPGHAGQGVLFAGVEA